MPLYEYECQSCGKRFERIQKYSDPLIDACPKCGSSVQKLLSSPAIQFKGSGFYITDYAKKDSGSSEKSKAEKAEKAEKSEKSGESSGSEAKTESKTEVKSETKTETKNDTPPRSNA
jgi:putative FmdB family regulatory protein